VGYIRLSRPESPPWVKYPDEDRRGTIKNFTEILRKLHDFSHRHKLPSPYQRQPKVRPAAAAATFDTAFYAIAAERGTEGRIPVQPRKHGRVCATRSSECREHSFQRESSLFTFAQLRRSCMHCHQICISEFLCAESLLVIGLLENVAWQHLI
jgi:hypothetical protein